MKISPSLILILGLVVAIVLLLLGLFLIVLPQNKKVGEVDEEIKKTETLYTQELARQKKLEELNKDPEQFIRQINVLKTKIPENVDLADVINQIDHAAEKAGLDFYSFTPTLPINAGSYYVVTIDAQFHGRYFNLVEFFNHVERLPRSIKVVKLGVRANDDTLPYLQIDVTFRAFFTTDKGVELLVPKTTAGGGAPAPAPGE